MIHKKIFFIAGEASGDLLGSEILSALSTRPQYTYSFQGIGGELMGEKGFTSVVPSTALSTMGLVEVACKMPYFYKLYKKIQRAIEAFQPDLIVTIDAPDFSFPIGRWAHCRGFKVQHVVAPTVWAWRPGRAAKITKFLSKLYCLYPFEPPLFQVHGLDARFVGHPLIDLGIENIDGGLFREARGIDKRTPLLCVLLGSRIGEVERLLPVFKQTTLQLQKAFPDLHLVIPTLPHVADLVRAESWACPTLIVTNKEEKYQAMVASTVALAASGTVTLELALAKIPTIVGYKMNGLSAFIARFLVKTPFVSLPNILLQKQIMPEFLQDKCTVENLSTQLGLILENRSLHRKIVSQLKAVKDRLTSPGMHPSRTIAEGILEDLAAPGAPAEPVMTEVF